jgi:hypothetical protein
MRRYQSKLSLDAVRGGFLRHVKMWSIRVTKKKCTERGQYSGYSILPAAKQTNCVCIFMVVVVAWRPEHKCVLGNLQLPRLRAFLRSEHCKYFEACRIWKHLAVIFLNMIQNCCNLRFLITERRSGSRRGGGAVIGRYPAAISSTVSNPAI